MLLAVLLIGVTQEFSKYIFQSFSHQEIEDVEALAGVIMVLLALFAGAKVYRLVAQSKKSEIEISKKQKVLNFLSTILFICLALTIIIFSASEQRITPSHLFGKVITLSVLLGAIVM